MILNLTLPLLLLLCTGMVAAQENVPLIKGQRQWTASLWWIVSDHHFDRAGTKTESIFEYGFYSVKFRGRQGISDRVSIDFSIPFNIAYSKLPLSGQRRQNSGLGDFNAGVHYTARSDSSLQLIGILMIQIPNAKLADNLSTGSNSFDQLLQVQAYSNYHIGHMDSWIGITGGFNNRGKDYNSEFRYGIEAGWFLDDKKVEASFNLHGIASVGKSENTYNQFPETLFSNQKEELTLSPSLRFKISRTLSVGLGVDAVLSGKNRAAGTGFEISVRKSG